LKASASVCTRAFRPVQVGGGSFVNYSAVLFFLLQGG
jgi:hypothetical protein